MSDVTERMRADLALRLSEERLETVFEQMLAMTVPHIESGLTQEEVQVNMEQLRREGSRTVEGRRPRAERKPAAREGTRWSSSSMTRCRF